MLDYDELIILPSNQSNLPAYLLNEERKFEETYKHSVFNIKFDRRDFFVSYKNSDEGWVSKKYLIETCYVEMWP